MENNERVKLHLFKDNGQYRDDVFVAVNGQSWQIQRGVDVEVPPEVAEVLEHSRAQDLRTAELIRKLEDEWQAGK